VKLDMGGGVFPREGYLNVDPYNGAADFTAPMWAVPLPDGSVESIWSSHSLEHVTKFQVVPTLKEWERLLVSGGTIEIEVPDLEWVCKNWLWRKSNDWHMDTIFGQATNEGEIHRTGFTREIMQSYIDQTGLKLVHFDVVSSHGQPSLHFVLEKP
jgi:predicted SAM-dependent methyltransferase